MKNKQIQFQFNGFILSQVISFLDLFVVIKKGEKAHTQFYTGSPNKSYIQSHLTPRWISLSQINLYKASWFLNPPRTKNIMLKKPISAAPTLQETLSRSAITNTLTKESYRNENT